MWNQGLPNRQELGLASIAEREAFLVVLADMISRRIANWRELSFPKNGSKPAQCLGLRIVESLALAATTAGENSRERHIEDVALG